MRTYLIQMGIRLVCFVGAVVAGGGVLTWVLIGAAIVLPYTAVIFANAGRDRVQYTTSPVELRAIAAGGDAGALGSADPGDSDRPGGDGPGADGPGGDGIGPSPNDKEHE